MTTDTHGEHREKDSFHIIFEHAIDGILIGDAETKRHVEANRSICRLLGYSHDEIVGLRVDDIHPPESLPAIHLLFERLLRGEISLAPEVPMLRKDGSFFYADVSATAVTWGGRECLLGIFRDCSQRMRAEAKIRRSEANLKRAEKIARIGNWEWNIETNELVWSDEVFRLFGVDPLTDKPDYDLVVKAIAPECRDRFLRAVEGALQREEPFDGKYRMIALDGKERFIHTCGEVVRAADGRPLSMFGVAQDITEQRETEEQVRRSLEEKTVMLREIHHRVKNNLQVVYSLLNMQARGVDDDSVRAKFATCRNRVLSMALIHETLYRSADFSRVDFKGYLSRLVASIADTYNRRDITVVVDMEPVLLDMNIGIPCGLIFHELIANSFKYAFVEGRAGAIRVGINRQGDGRLVLFVEDNGCGLPADIDIRNTATLGMRLINALATQIHGTIEISRSVGTSSRVTFPGSLPLRPKGATSALP